MARRAGKAASRKARQRSTARPQRPAVPSAPLPAPSTDVAPEADPSVTVPPVGTPDARAARTLDPATRRTVAAGALGSALTDRERSQYHYVERDLRNIGVLTAIMAALLLAAWVVFGLLGLAR